MTPLRRLGLLAACVLAAGAASVAAAAPSQSPFDSLPALQAGVLNGKLVYLTGKDCRARSFDLATLADTPIGAGPLCPSAVGTVLSPDGRLLAYQDFRSGSLGRFAIVRVDGSRRITLGRALYRPIPRNFQNLPLFSPDSRRIAFCSVSRGQLETVVADTGTGRTLEVVRGSCEAAFTQKGLAVRLGSRVVIGGRAVVTIRGAKAATGVGDAIASNPQGTRLAVLVRPSGDSSQLQIRVYRLSGREVGRFTAAVPIPTSIYTLAPNGAAAVVWWGCILQLAPLDAGRHSFRLRYGSDGEPVSYPAFSPDGSFAAMPRSHPLLPGEPSPPPELLILDGRSFKGLYKVGIDVGPAVWLR